MIRYFPDDPILLNMYSWDRCLTPKLNLFFQCRKLYLLNVMKVVNNGIGLFLVMVVILPSLIDLVCS